jgi:hypothetical protein
LSLFKTKIQVEGLGSSFCRFVTNGSSYDNGRLAITGRYCKSGSLVIIDGSVTPERGGLVLCVCTLVLVRGIVVVVIAGLGLRIGKSGFDTGLSLDGSGTSWRRVDGSSSGIQG